MAQTKEKVVFTAEPAQLRHIQEQVKEGRYRSASEFLREAVDEKLARLRRERLSRQVARYCAETVASETSHLINAQAFEDDEEQ